MEHKPVQFVRYLSDRVFVDWGLAVGPLVICRSVRQFETDHYQIIHAETGFGVLRYYDTFKELSEAIKAAERLAECQGWQEIKRHGPELTDINFSADLPFYKDVEASRNSVLREFGFDG